MIFTIFFIVLFCNLIFTFYPLFKKYDLNIYFDENKEVDNYRKNLLDQIKELNFEKEMGIISDEDYKFIKDSLLIEISKLIKK